MRYRCEDVSVQQRHSRSSAGDMIPTISALVREQPWRFLEDVGSLGTPFLSFQKKRLLLMVSALEQMKRLGFSSRVASIGDMPPYRPDT